MQADRLWAPIRGSRPDPGRRSGQCLAQCLAQCSGPALGFLGIMVIYAMIWSNQRDYLRKNMGIPFGL